MSKTELAVIKNQSLTECVNLNYGQFDIKMIQKKLNKFVVATLQKQSLHNAEFLHYDNKSKTFGSFFCPSSDQIDGLFVFVRELITDAYENDYTGLILLNYVTIYTAFYLAVCTMCRPEFLSSVSLRDICLLSNHVKIDDKLNSARIAAISKNCSVVLSGYVSFIKRNMVFYSVQSSSLASVLQIAIDGVGPLFSINKKGITSNFSVKEALNLVADTEPKYSNLKENFSRHFSAAFLTDMGVNRDQNARTMGHANESEYANRFSSLNIGDLSNIAESLDSGFLCKHFIEWEELR